MRIEFGAPERRVPGALPLAQRCSPPPPVGIWPASITPSHGWRTPRRTSPRRCSVCSTRWRRRSRPSCTVRCPEGQERLWEKALHVSRESRRGRRLGWGCVRPCLSQTRSKRRDGGKRLGRGGAVDGSAAHLLFFFLGIDLAFRRHRLFEHLVGRDIPWPAWHAACARTRRRGSEGVRCTRLKYSTLCG